MLTVDEALAHVLDQTSPLEHVEMPLAGAAGLVLAEPAYSDIDSPPYDKSLVDGYAVLAADLSSGSAELRLLEEIVAGQVPTRGLYSGVCTRIMTGAPIPDGADAVVMVERSRELKSDGESADCRPRIELKDAIRPHQNIMRRATSMKRGDLVLQPGTPLMPRHIGLLAEVGRSHVQVVRRPRVAILATGNELVPCHQVPGPGQIRNSNGIMLHASASEAGAEAIDLGIARDEVQDLTQKVSAGLECDVLVLSGGVSAGVLDLVPMVLRACGVEQVFHKVRLKPGQPLWFGKRTASEPRSESDHTPAGGCLVFGLPGNPVSSLVCFELFVRPAIAKLSGRQYSPQVVTGRLSRSFTHKGERPTYYPSRLQESAGGSGDAVVEPVAWQGSADLNSVAQATALIEFPAGDRQYEAGSAVNVRLL